MKIAGAACGHGVLNQDGGGQDAAQVVGRKFQNRNLAARQILLVADVLIRSDEKREFALSQSQPVAVFETAPASTLRRGTFVTDEEFVHGPGNTFIKQDVHAAGASSADSDRSRRR
ncbi:MAG: hypothetical protein EXS33_01800 [Pedosphaera sp.]|nr:hypothetical protein [Pedosphaera sp.]